MADFGGKVSFIWSVADLLRGPYRPPQYGRVILPLTVLRRLDCVLEQTKDKVLAKAAQLKGGKVANTEPILNRVAKASFHNTSKLDFQKLKGEPDKIAGNLTHYIKSFSSQVRDIFEKSNFEPEIARLEENNRLFLVVSKFAAIDCPPADAEAVRREVYRFVDRDPPAASDFVPVLLKRPDIEPGKRCQAAGLSVFTDLADAARQRRRFKGFRRRNVPSEGLDCR